MNKKLTAKMEKDKKDLYAAKGLLEEELAKLEREYARGVSTLDSTKLEELQQRIDNKKYQIKDVKEKIDEILDDEDQLKNAEQENNSYKWNEVAPLIKEAIADLNMSYNVETNKFIYCMDMGQENVTKNPVFRTFEGTRAERVIGKHINKWLFDANVNIIKLFMTQGNTHYQETASFFKSKWSADKVYNKAGIIRKFWLEPVFEQAYHPDFDLLMYCVGGGKQENIDHLEQWLAYKYFWPERIANTPNLDLGGNPGGNGKTLYTEMAKTIFTPNCVVPAVAKELMDGFNASWELAVILHFDEPEEKELPASKMKNATGGLEQRVERKGVDAYSSDRNYNIIATSNNELGVFKLAGTGSGGEDRRYSVINTNIPLVDELMERESITVDEAKVRANKIAQMIKDHNEVARWLGAMILKYNIHDMAVLPPLHGHDYHERFQDQKTGLDSALDGLMTIAIQQGCIGVKNATDLLAIKLSHKNKPTGKTVAKWMSTWLTKNKISYTKIERQRINIQWKGKQVDNREQTVFEFVQGARKFDWDEVSITNYTMLASTQWEDLLF